MQYIGVAWAHEYKFPVMPLDKSPIGPVFLQKISINHCVRLGVNAKGLKII